MSKQSQPNCGSSTASARQAFRSLFDGHSAAILLLDADRPTVIEANAAACALYGKSAEELRHQLYDHLRLDGCVNGDLASRRAERHVVDGGAERDVEVATGRLELDGRPYRIAIVHDITEQRMAERASMAEKERLAVTLGSIADGVLTTDLGGSVRLLNPAAESILGLANHEAQGLPLPQILCLQGEEAERFSDPVARLSKLDATTFTDTVTMRPTTGVQRTLELNCAPLREDDGSVGGVVLAFRDVTQRRRIEDERARAQKLEALGILAGGIAHDFNNLLTVVLGNLSMIDAEARREIEEPLTHAESAVRKAKGLTRQLLTFSRGGAPVREAASIAELVAESTTFALRGTKITNEVDIDEDLPVVEIDVNQIHQVLNNLLINAVQAMPRGGHVHVEARNTSRPPAPLPPGHYVRVTVADTGLGIPRERLSRIFDPYYSTKPRGTGLGLATAFSIVRRHEGLLTVDSTPGEGAAFHIYLPAARSEILRASEREADEASLGSGSVLFMEDDLAVRRVTSLMLRDLGYDVTTAGDGAEAIDLYCEARRRRRPFDLVITDLTVVGGMGGQEAIARLRDIDPNVVAIVASGYANDPVLARYREYGFRGALHKPFSAQELGRTLRQVLRETSAQSAATPQAEEQESPTVAPDRST